MPPTEPVPNAIRADFTFDVGEDANVLARLHWRYAGGPPSVADAVGIATNLATAYTDQIAKLCLAGTLLNIVRVVDLASPAGADGTFAAAAPGLRVGNFLPAGCCMLSNYHISRRYRGGKPRTYWPFGVDSDLKDGQTWAPAFVSEADTAMALFLTQCLGAGAGTTTLNAFINISYFLGFKVVTSPTTGRARNVPTPRVPPLVDVINTTTTNPKVAYQRRRSVR